MRISILILSLFIFSNTMFAEGSSNEQSKSKVTYKKTTKLDFEDAGVDGDFLNPDGQSLNADQNLSFDSMLEPKDNFQGELKRSMGAVR